MKSLSCWVVGFAVLGLGTFLSRAEVKVATDHNDSDRATAAFKFKTAPAPSKTDAATKAKFVIVDGERDENGGELDKLHDGKLPSEEDEPAENFFFNAGTEGGRLLVDLGSVLEVRQVNSYSWHPNTRGPQVYKLFAADGTADGFNAKPAKGTDPEKTGWKLVAKVDTRPKDGEGGGQYAASVTDSEGPLGKYRYLLFDIARTEDNDAFGNTFYSEIDVVAADDAGAKTADAAGAEGGIYKLKSADGYCDITINTRQAPDLKEWAETKLAPVLADWYPKIVGLLPSDGYSAPTSFSVTLERPGRGVAATGGTRITANADWLKGELNREAVGALVHEEVHVVQQYRGRRNNPDAKPTPGWLTEGIPDYIRWFLYEPQSHGADAAYFKRLKARGNLNLSYDARYRVSANFLNYVAEKHGRDLVTKLNAACRQGKYDDEIWKTATGKTVLELNDEWKAATEKLLVADAGASTGSLATQATENVESGINTLSAAEKAAGWKLLFNGKDLAGWHNFRSEGVKAGWQVKDGALVCVDPHNAGDIVTADQFDWFELQLDYNISEGGNSGIMYHVTDEGRSAWATGPEFQLEDNAKAADPVRCGWLYGLYTPPVDDKTGKPLDATKPAGEWNHVRLLLSPEKCEHDINGVKYFEYVLGSEDFTNRVAKSKFARMPGFAKSTTGHVALQGDHGQVSFRNIKLLPLQPK